MRTLPSELARPLAAIATAALLVAGVAGCSGDDEPSSTPSDSADSSAAAATDEKPDKPTKQDPATDPNSPFVVAASAVAQRSRDQVTQLHVMGVATVGSDEAGAGLPAREIPSLADAIDTALGQQITDSTMMPPPKASPAADLVASLRDYQALAKDLAKWKPNGQALDQAWFGKLKDTDKVWKAALRDLGELSGQDLLDGLAPLVMPDDVE